MDCVLIRHGVAVERDEWEGDDADRPLTDDGVKRVRQVAAGLKRLDLCPTHIFSSPLVRAVETAGILCAVLELPEAVTQVPDLSPDADLEGALTTLRRLPPDSCVFCVGHEPHLGLLAGLLLTGKPSQAFHFKKAGACLIELPRSVKPCQGLLRWWMEPGQLRALGKKKAKARIKVES